jgi:hypothetical protein
VREGICVEISFGGIIRNNRSPERLADRSVPRNGWLWDAGIGVHESRDVEVYGNTLTENFNGIAIVQQRRDSTTHDIYAPAGGYLAQNVYVHDNTLYQRNGGASGAANDLGDLATFNTANNRWVHNTYFLGTNPAPFAWVNGYRTAAAWRGYGQDVDGRVQPMSSSCRMVVSWLGAASADTRRGRLARRSRTRSAAWWCARHNSRARSAKSTAIGSATHAPTRRSRASEMLTSSTGDRRQSHDWRTSASRVSTCTRT